ncbi:MAG: type IV secretion protein DotN [Alphaproteobacteria bacterium]|nr:type IV secretion protein DotN [Alphaproteobacteria bacterium]
MNFLPITLGVRRSPGAKKGKALPDPKSQTEKTLRLDDYACRFCGFRAKRYQRVIPHIDADGEASLVTACTFCEQCVTLERAGITGPGVLLWLPEIGQAELNHAARAIYIARRSEGPIAEAATRALDALMARRADAKKRLGGDDPLLLATVLQETLDEKEITQATAKLDGIRLLPPDKYLVRGPKGDTNQFPQMVKYWCSSEGPYANLPERSWMDMFKTASASIGNA